MTINTNLSTLSFTQSAASCRTLDGSAIRIDLATAQIQNAAPFAALDCYQGPASCTQLAPPPPPAPMMHKKKKKKGLFKKIKKAVSKAGHQLGHVAKGALNIGKSILKGVGNTITYLGGLKFLPPSIRPPTPFDFLPGNDRRF